MVGKEDKRTNNRAMLPTLENNAAAGYQGPVKMKLLEGAGVLGKTAYQKVVLRAFHLRHHIL